MTTTPTPGASTAGTTDAPSPPGYPAAPAAAAPPRTLSILSLVAAIASVPLGHVVILPIAAIVLGFVARNREPWARNVSNWGIGVGFVVLFFWVIVGAIAAAIWVPLAILHHVWW